LNIGRIQGGVAANVIPPEAEAEILLRVVTETGALKSIIEEAVGGRVEIEYTFACDPVFTEMLDGFETAVVAFTTDIPRLTNWGRPLLFGPGSILDAHTAHEKISKKEMVEAVDAYRSMVVRLKQKE
jgi:acetylornithine deacetylase